jgi:hypothetical protein
MNKKFVQAAWRAYKLLDKTLLRKDVMTFAEFCNSWNEHLEWLPEKKPASRDLLIAYYTHYLFDNFMRSESQEFMKLLAANDHNFPEVDQCAGF